MKKLATYSLILSLVTVVRVVSAQTNISAGTINNVVMADTQTGSDACAKITTAVGKLPSTGGVIDARGFQGTQGCAIAPNFTGSGMIEFGNVVFQLSSSASSWTIPHGWFIQGPWNRGDLSGVHPGLHFQAIAGFPPMTPMVTIGSATPFDEGPTLMNAWVDCNGIASTAITSSTINEKGGIKRVQVTECTGTHVNVITGMSNSPQNYVIDELEILSTHTNISGQTGLIITATGASFGQVSNVTVIGNPSSRFQTCISVDNWTGGVMSHIHCEEATDALTLCVTGSTCNGGSFSDITGNPGVTNSIVHIKAGLQSSHLTSVSQQGPPGTTAHTLIDDVNTVSYDDYTIPMFDASIFSEPTRSHYVNVDRLSTFSGGISQLGTAFFAKNFGAGCTTAAAIGAVCSTIYVIGVVEPDTNWYPVCNISSTASGVPVIQQAVATSTTQFSVSFAAMTTVPAQAGGVSCTFTHP